MLLHSAQRSGGSDATLSAQDWCSDTKCDKHEKQDTSLLLPVSCRRDSGTSLQFQVLVGCSSIWGAGWSYMLCSPPYSLSTLLDTNCPPSSLDSIRAGAFCGSPYCNYSIRNPNPWQWYGLKIHCTADATAPNAAELKFYRVLFCNGLETSVCILSLSHSYPLVQAVV